MIYSNFQRDYRELVCYRDAPLCQSNSFTSTAG